MFSSCPTSTMFERSTTKTNKQTNKNLTSVVITLCSFRRRFRFWHLQRYAFLANLTNKGYCPFSASWLNFWDVRQTWKQKHRGFPRKGWDTSELQVSVWAICTSAHNKNGVTVTWQRHPIYVTTEQCPPPPHPCMWMEILKMTIRNT